MPGFLGGGGSGGGAGGEISFPKEFIDPVTKLRVSQPTNLIDTDFEYGLQPTKWETVELINNTPSFFSKSGDTTIPNIVSITTNAGTREIIVKTSNEHLLDVGIPINVTGTKSVTADGAYIINSIPNETTFTYLCRDIQPTTASIEDLYSSIITGEFFQGSQLRISTSEGITTDAGGVSILTVKTPSPHGFGVNTPFYFLNLNSTVSQEFASANTETRAFDASNSATAQIFDGSNTLSQINIDYSNSAVVAGVVSNITSVNVEANTITVAHGTENFANLRLGDPLYYNVVSSTGYFSLNPRGVVFIKTVSNLGTSSSTFQVSTLPDGEPIDLFSTMTGTFQRANQARTFAGNNVNPLTEQVVQVINNTPIVFDGANTLGKTAVVQSYSAGNVNVVSSTGLADLDWYFGTMLFYSTTGSVAAGLTNNTTYFVDNFFQQGTSNVYTFTLKPLPTSATITSISGGTGTQTFKQIGISVDKNVFHVRNNGFQERDMLRYDYPVDGRFDAADISQEVNFYFVSRKYDSHNFIVSQTVGELIPRTVSRTGFTIITPIAPTTVTPVGLQTPITYSVVSGPLPGGLTLNTSTGVVSGTPTETIAAPGRTVIIRATDANGVQADQIHTYQFTAPPELYSFSSVTFTPGGAGGSTGPDLAQARSGAGNPSWATQYINMDQTNRRGTILWTVPQSGTYRIDTYGGQGGASNGWGRGGAGGARMQGDFNLTINEVLKIVVGQAAGGAWGIGGGGGGSYVTRSNDALLVAAGGGGGAGPSDNPSGGTTGSSGIGTQNSGGGSSQGGGFGGGGNNAGGGGGFNTNGGGSWPGVAFLNGSFGGGGTPGGFGGGGGCETWSGSGGGGGGGYAGGGGAGWSWSGGGGGSLNNGANQVNQSGVRGGNGQVTITRL